MSILMYASYSFVWINSRSGGFLASEKGPFEIKKCFVIRMEILHWLTFSVVAGCFEALSGLQKFEHILEMSHPEIVVGFLS